MSAIARWLARLAGVRPLAALSCAVALSACGGGGGGSGEAPPPPPPPNLVSITAQNQKLLAADALQSATDTNLAMFAAMLLMGQPQGGQAATAQLLATSRPASVTSAMATLRSQWTSREPVQCAYGGELSVSGNYYGGSYVTAGDSVTLDASNCTEDWGGGVISTVNGVVTASVLSGSFDSAYVVYPFRIVLGITARNFSIGSGAHSMTFDGDVLMDISESSATRGTIVLSGAAVRSTYGSDGDLHASTLRNYRNEIRMDGALVTNGISASVETSNKWLGSVAYELTTPVQLVESSGAFTSGTLKLAGRNSALLVTGTGADAFSLRLDADGDGGYEGNASTTKSELEGYI